MQKSVEYTTRITNLFIEDEVRKMLKRLEDSGDSLVINFTGEQVKGEVILNLKTPNISLLTVKFIEEI